ncbi:D(2) dopamine receptor A-like [Patiria miniata]|uniref:G-protein coupled receptors family 1 profile domain-containing protein n=1 Tax=Patiria miniata TaxID=46514 RepID=A0A914B5H4_PATMI|nr:D(2) dopamine receptor A-like [Patiria miniata]
MEAFLWPLVIFHIIVGVVGLPGNALIVLVYGRKRQLMSPHVFILALAVADLMVCLFTPVTVYHWYIRLNYTSDFLCRLVLTVTFVTVYNSCFLTSAIAVDRYQAICRPHRRWMTVRRAKITAVVCPFLAILISVPVFLSYDVEPHAQESDTGVCTHSKTVPIWVTYLMTTVIYAASLFTLVTNIVLYGKMYRAIRKRAAVQPGHDRANGPAESMTCTGPRPTSKNAPLSTCQSGTEVATVSDQEMMNVNQRIQTANTSGQHLRTYRQNCGKRQQKQKQKSQQQVGLHNMCLHQQQLREEEEQQQQQQHHETSFTLNIQNLANVSTVNRLSNQLATGTTDNPVRQRRQRPQTQRLHGKTTKMLLITTAVFFATWLPALCIFVLPQDVENFIHDNNQVGYSLLYLFRFIFYLNNAINPLIYGFVNERFREDCKKTLSALTCFCRVTR